jgi:RNA polymerase sigma-70 factor, ECF subfamily
MVETHGEAAPDSDLIALAKQGDREAFGQLYERYADALYRYVRTRVGSDQDAEDLTENIFVRCFESLATYEERGWPYSAFLYQIARNLLVNYYRQSTNQQPLEEGETIEAGEPGPEQTLAEREEVHRARTALARLPDDYQEVIRLRVLMDLPTNTAAEWMDKSEGAVRVLLHRALKALRKELDA